MRTFCAVCHGEGTVNDPKVGRGPMAYCDEKGHSWPQMPCPNCGGCGLVGVPDNPPDLQKRAYREGVDTMFQVGDRPLGGLHGEL
jgi:RecJ-like exonuclease